MKIETKNFSLDIKSVDEKGIFTAYASTFGNTDHDNDVVMKGAFKKTLLEKSINDIFMFWQHDPEQIIGEWVEMKEDEHGLLCKGQLFLGVIQKADEAYFLMKKKLIKKLSIGFKIIEKAYESGKRLLKEIDLVETSIVTFPANDRAEILGVKSQDNICIRKLEEVLRDAGFSRKQAKAVCAEGYKGLNQCDADEGEQETNEQKERPIWSEIINELKDFKL